ncbi:MAG: TetR/AcrR family transcriptional regulator [Chrysiogenetes bacterium]|nr:TetR/AcrR family transcriptional regulator [Chrysiogenetes bacterium]
MNEMAAKPVIRHPSQDRILDEAEVLFANRGYAGMGLSELAEKAGLSKSSLFHHFPSKIEIYAAVLERVFERLWDLIQNSADEGGTQMEKIEGISDVMNDFLAGSPHTARLLLRSLIERDFEDSGITREELAKRHGAYVFQILQFAAKTLEEGIENGEFRKQSVGHFVQTLIGALLFHFASGENGVVGFRGSIFEPERVERRKEELKAFLRGAVLAK